MRQLGFGADPGSDLRFRHRQGDWSNRARIVDLLLSESAVIRSHAALPTRCARRVSRFRMRSRWLALTIGRYCRRNAAAADQRGHESRRTWSRRWPAHAGPHRREAMEGRRAPAVQPYRPAILRGRPDAARQSPTAERDVGLSSAHEPEAESATRVRCRLSLLLLPLHEFLQQRLGVIRRRLRRASRFVLL